MAYIYIIKNDINDKVYVGKTIFPVEKRFKEHINDSKRKRNEQRPLYNAFNKYGVEHFYIEELEECDSLIASEREQYWIEYYHSYHFGYNATLGGDGNIYLPYKEILSLYDNTSLNQEEIASKINCSADSVKNIVKQYRDNVDWSSRYIKRNEVNCLGIKGKPVVCVETQEIFPSSTQAANWLVSEGAIKSQAYGRGTIPKVCRGERNTVGDYHWRYK